MMFLGFGFLVLLAVGLVAGAAGSALWDFAAWWRGRRRLGRSSLVASAVRGLPSLAPGEPPHPAGRPSGVKGTAAPASKAGPADAFRLGFMDHIHDMNGAVSDREPADLAGGRPPFPLPPAAGQEESPCRDGP